MIVGSVGQGKMTRLRNSSILFSLLIWVTVGFAALHSNTVPGISYEKTESFAASPQQGSLERIAMRLFKTAVEKYENEAYWHATRELIILLDFYPSFSKTDAVVYYLGECLYEMDMFKSSAKMFRYLLKTYPKSEYLPKALFSLQRLYYNTQALENSLNYFIGITTRFPKDDILDGAYYYGGMAYFHQKNYDEAIRAFGRIRSRSEYYDYGLYTVGLCFLKKKISSSPSKSFRS